MFGWKYDVGEIYTLICVCVRVWPTLELCLAAGVKFRVLCEEPGTPLHLMMEVRLLSFYSSNPPLFLSVSFSHTHKDTLWTTVSTVLLLTSLLLHTWHALSVFHSFLYLLSLSVAFFFFSFILLSLSMCLSHTFSCSPYFLLSLSLTF